jgi:hypothetical protein
MVAWRRPSGQRTLGGTAPTTATGKVIYTTGSDDDGEKYAGKRLERVLVDLDVQGTIVVARWYGGVLLGPVRFTHIEMVAREAITQWKQKSPGQIGEGLDVTKRQKTATEACGSQPTSTAQDKAKEDAERSRLAKQLADRDNSIVVLRQLLAEKIAPSTSTTTSPNDSFSEQPSTSQPTITSPAKKQVDYSIMPLQTLRQLDKARDATISFILKQIDKAEDAGKKDPMVTTNSTPNNQTEGTSS